MDETHRAGETSRLMRHPLVVTLVGVLALAFITLLGWQANETTNLKAGQAELKATIKAVKADVDELKATVDVLKATVDALNMGQTELNATIDAVKADVDELKRGQERLPVRR